MGENGILGSLSDIQAYYDPAQPGSRWSVNDTGTPWVRLWADWPTLQPNASDPLGGTAKFAQLDSEVQAANADQRLVMLVAYRYPPWSNGLTGQAGQPDPDPNYSARTLGWHAPTSGNIAGAWSAFIQHLIIRYHALNPSRQGIVHALEICNEPNAQMYPQSGLASTVAQMMQAALQAKYAAGAKGAGPLLLGPAVADTVLSNPSYYTPYDQFTEAVLNALAAANWYPDTEFGWSQHNYTDIEQNQGGAASVTPAGNGQNAAAYTRGRLAALRGSGWAWKGWPRADEADTRVFLTEGGARLSVVGSESAQVSRLSANYDRMTTGADGSGIDMLTWYTVVGNPYQSNGQVDPNDTGLRRPEPGNNYPARPAYSTWKNTVQPGNTSLYHWHGWEDLGGPVLGGFDACSWGVGRLDVFVRGVDTGVYHTWLDNGWHNWEYMNGTTNADPTAASWGPGRIDLFVRDAGNSQCLHRWFDNGQWSSTPWEALGGTFYSGLDACSWGPGRLDIFGLGTDYNVWHKWWAGGWAPSQTTWESLGGVGSPFTSDPAAVSWGNGHVDVYVRGPSSTGAPNRGIWHKYFYSGSWSTWQIVVDDQQIDTAPDASSWGSGRIDLFWLRNGQLRHKWYDAAAGGWFTSQGIGANVNSNPGAVSWGSGRIDVFARSASGSCSHTWYP